MLYNSKKAVTFIDAPKGHPLLREVGDYQRDATKTLRFNFKKPFEDNLRAARAVIRKAASLDTKIEDFKLKQLKPRLARLLEEYPNLRKKSRIRVLVYVGAVHTRFYHRLKREQKEVSRMWFKASPYVFGGSFNEAVRRGAFNKEIPDDVVVRVFLENEFIAWLADDLLKATRDKDQISAFIRKIVSKFSRSELEAMFNKAKVQTESRKYFRLLLYSALRSKGLELSEIS